MVVSGAKGAGTRASATVTVITQILMISNDVAPTYGSECTYRRELGRWVPKFLLAPPPCIRGIGACGSARSATCCCCCDRTMRWRQQNAAKRAFGRLAGGSQPQTASSYHRLARADLQAAIVKEWAGDQRTLDRQCLLRAQVARELDDWADNKAYPSGQDAPPSGVLGREWAFAGRTPGAPAFPRPARMVLMRP